VLYFLGNIFFLRLTFLEYRTESNSIELVRSTRIDYFLQYFDVFSSSVRSIEPFGWVPRTHVKLGSIRFGEREKF